jgi:MFS family permease
LNELETKKAMNGIIVAACAIAPSLLIFHNGFLLSFLSKIGIQNSMILYLLAVPALTKLFLLIPVSFLSDRVGKKKIGVLALLIYLIGFLFLLGACFFAGVVSRVLVVIGIILIGIGITGYGSSWFAILNPIIPQDIRGRFFGRLRVSWTVIGVLATYLVSVILERYNSFNAYAGILAFFCFLVLLKIYFYKKIPESLNDDKPGEDDNDSSNFRTALSVAISTKGFIPFCCYTFLLNLFIGAIPFILGLLEKDVLNLPPSELIFLGNLMLIGNIFGYHIGGKLVDSIGTKKVFLYCHFLFAINLFLFSCRGLIPQSSLWTMSVLILFFGISTATSSIAFTSELFSLLPKKNISLATSVNTAFREGAVAIAGVMVGLIIDLKILRDNWSIGSLKLSQYDAILMGSGVMIILIAITLSLVPSVVKKSYWIPSKH